MDMRLSGVADAIVGLTDSSERRKVPAKPNKADMRLSGVADAIVGLTDSSERRKVPAKPNKARRRNKTYDKHLADASSR
jgi:hypothetical protein